VNSLVLVLSLIGPPDNTDSFAIPDQSQDALGSGKSEPNTTDGNKFKQWKSVASATAKLFLRGVKESADAFPPLKSVVSGLCFIVDNFEVSSSTQYTLSTALTSTLANKCEQPSSKIIGTQGHSPLWLTLSTCF